MLQIVSTPVELVLLTSKNTRANDQSTNDKHSRRSCEWCIVTGVRTNAPTPGQVTPGQTPPRTPGRPDKRVLHKNIRLLS